jgi:hypothetical protein
VKRLTLLLLLPALLAGCDTKAKQQLAELSKADSLRQDSLLAIKNQLLNDMLVSTQFVNDIDAEIAKARSLPKPKAGAKLATPAEAARIKEDREETLGKIRMLVARLDSTDARLRSMRTRVASLSKRDSTLSEQIAQYEKTIADFRETVERQKTEFQAIIDQQNQQIASLKGQVDTLTTVKTALADTVGQLTTEKNLAYYVAGTRDELVQKGVLVEEGNKKFLLFGDRPVKMARTLDTSTFTRIDRLKDRDITLPDGEYSVFTPQDMQYATAYQTKNGHITGGLHVAQPEQFWANSKFLILVKH